MQAAAQTTALPIKDDLDEAVEDAIRASGGSRAAIKALILGQQQLMDEIAGTVSAGYVRRRLSK